jgi:glycosyltransferase involved in cell wall biosynthesis
MKILVVTPTLGESPWLAETVASVAALPLACTHVLVAPATVASALAARFPRATVVVEPGGGMYAAINAGFAAAHDWEAFTYVNDDDLLLPAFARVAEAAARNRSQPLLAYGRVRLIDGQGRRLGAIPVSPWPQLNRDLYAQRLEPVFQHGTLVSRAAWERHGGFDPAFRFCGDSEFLARLCVRGVPAVYLVGEVAAFRLHGGQLTKNRPAMDEERKRVDKQLGLLAERFTARHHWARLVFRVANLPVYAGRIARHGFVSFDELLERGG